MKMLTLRELEYLRQQVENYDWAHTSSICLKKGEIEKILNTIYHLLGKVVGVDSEAR